MSSYMSLYRKPHISSIGIPVQVVEIILVCTCISTIDVVVHEDLSVLISLWSLEGLEL